MNFLVTGASGFVGLNLLERLLAKGHRVTALSADDIPPAARAEFARFPGNLQIVRQTCATRARSRRHCAVRAQAVLAGAAVTAGVAREREAPAQIIEVNLAAVLKLIALSGGHGVRQWWRCPPARRSANVSSAASRSARTSRPRHSHSMGLARPHWRRPRSLDNYSTRNAGGDSRTRFSGFRSVGARHGTARHTLAAARNRRRCGARRGCRAATDWRQARLGGSAVRRRGPRVDAHLARVEHRLYNLGAGFTWHPRDHLALGARACGCCRKSQARRRSPQRRSRPRAHASRHGCLAQEFQPPPALAAATQSYARWVAAHAGWFRG